MSRTTCLFLLFAGLFFSCKPIINREPVYYLKNGKVRMGILPNHGGTVVFFGKGDSTNLLLSDTTLWSMPYDEATLLKSISTYVPINGHTVWLGPQNKWWLDQDIDTLLKQQRAQWPPDPVLVAGRYATTNHSSDLLSLISPVTPYSGIQMEKDFMIDPDGLTTLNVRIKNVRYQPVSWDIWFNTRVNVWDRCYVPVNKSSPVIVREGNDSTNAGIPYRIEDGFFTFIPEKPDSGKEMCWSKAYIFPERPWIAAFIGKHILLIRFENLSKEMLHPEQSLVEIYLRTSKNPADELLELEHHTSYNTLQPGDIMKGWETWEILDYKGGNSLEDHVAYLRKIGI